MEAKFAIKPKVSDVFKNPDRVFAVLGVPADQDEHLRVLDVDKVRGLYLVHYLSPNENNFRIRGVTIRVTDGVEPKIVCMSYPYTEEFTYSEFLSMTSYHPSFTGNYRVTCAEEGTIIRVFYGVDRWFLSTHKRIDGSRSRWSGPTFGEMFNCIWPTWNEDCERNLSKDMCYVFLLSHPENRLVCKIDTPSLVLVGIYAPKSGSSLMMFRPPTLVTEMWDSEVTPFRISDSRMVDNMTEFLESVSELDWRTSTGLLYTDLDTGFSVKVMPDEYFNKRQVRGNEPNLRLRYIQLGSSGGSELRNLFPEKSEFFDSIDRDLEALTPFLEVCYRRRYIDREYVIYPQDTFLLITRVYNDYDKNKTVHDNINRHLKLASARQLNSMIRHMLDVRNPKPKSCPDSLSTDRRRSDNRNKPECY